RFPEPPARARAARARLFESRLLPPAAPAGWLQVGRRLGPASNPLTGRQLASVPGAQPPCRRVDDRLPPRHPGIGAGRLPRLAGTGAPGSHVSFPIRSRCRSAAIAQRPRPDFSSPMSTRTSPPRAGVTGTLPDLAPDLRAVLERHADRLDLELVERALRFSATAHRGQKRMSGEDFVSHTIAVALILAEQLLDSTTIAAALLHDVVEDSDVRTEDIAREFGPEVAGIVDGLTKISSLTFHSSAEEQVENYRKLLLSIAKDARVIIIKLGDRLHNMRTLEHLPPERRTRIALETREIYAPLAHRFGMAGIKAELEDLAFKFLESEEYKDLATQVAAKRAAREQTILKLKTPLDAELRDAGIEWFEVTGRPKHLWSIFQKMKKRGKAFDEIYDLMAVRVIVRTVPDCYHVLGIIHHNWTPIQERIKDYIASPKSNAYQSPHTTIFAPGGQLFEVQTRTHHMHRPAQYGIAAPGVYKRDGSRAELDQHLGWFRQLLELQQDTHSPEEFLEFLKIDLYQDEIFIFTPHGDVKRLP